jgi:hypothetical protein
MLRALDSMLAARSDLVTAFRSGLPFVHGDGATIVLIGADMAYLLTMRDGAEGGTTVVGTFIHMRAYTGSVPVITSRTITNWNTAQNMNEGLNEKDAAQLKNTTTADAIVAGTTTADTAMIMVEDTTGIRTCAKICLCRSRLKAGTALSRTDFSLSGLEFGAARQFGRCAGSGIKSRQAKPVLLMRQLLA